MAEKVDKLELKLLVEKESQKVLFAEVGKDVVDFLFRLFSLPMGSVISLITKESTIGSLGNMYRSWDQLDENFLSSSRMKAHCLVPEAKKNVDFARLLSAASPATVTENIYKCSRKCNCYFTEADDLPRHCNGCCRLIHMQSCLTPLSYTGNRLTKEEFEENGYVKDNGTTFALMEDLSMVPLKGVLSIVPLVNKMGLKDLSLLEEKIVTLDVHTEGLELLKTSMWSKNVLTDVFMAKKNDENEKQVK